MQDETPGRTFPKPESSIKKTVEITKSNITYGQLDTLVALVEKGPLFDGDVTSKTSRNELIDCGLASRIINKGEQGYQAATYKGSTLYCEIFGNSGNIRQAKAYRVMQRELRAVRDLGKN